MGQTIFRIIPEGEQWVFEHDDEKRAEYVSKEAAFEAAVIAAQRAMREGFEVQILVDGRPNVLANPN